LRTNQIDFFNKIKNSFENERPFVVFSKPNSNEVFSYIQNSQELFELKSYDESGFVFVGFEDDSSKIIFPFKECKKGSIVYNSNNYHPTIEDDLEFKVIFNSKNKEEYIQLVSKTVDYIEKTNIDKIVLSRKEILQVKSFDIISVYEKMLNSYKNAYVYCWFHPKVGLWMGASPERFLNIENNQFKTIALAGTQEFKGHLNVVWEEKEKEEQQFVTDFILSSISSIFDTVEVSEPYTVKAGSLLHLRSDISSPKVSSKSIQKLVKELHPTPAVCGLPKESAKDFILKNEGYKRHYYTGFLGALNVNNNTNFYVNLRCMEIENAAISIYVGGGITSRSNPLNEWGETVSKTNVMKKVIK